MKKMLLIIFHLPERIIAVWISDSHMNLTAASISVSVQFKQALFAGMFL